MPIHFYITYKTHCIYPVLYNDYGPVSRLIFNKNKSIQLQNAKKKSAEAAYIALYAASYVTLFVNDIVYFIESLHQIQVCTVIANAAKQAIYVGAYATHIVNNIANFNSEKNIDIDIVEGTNSDYPSNDPDYQLPLITIIMTTYNCAKYVLHAIQSIQNQTIINWEFIIIDDCSEDNSDSIIREIANKDNRIIYFRNAYNVGCYVSKNIGILHARGDWITFQDADDYSLSNRLQLQFEACTKYQYDCSYVKFLTRKSLRWSWAPISLFINKKVFENTFGFFDCVRVGADSELHNRIILSNFKIYITNEYQYACIDKWVELEEDENQSRVSLTSNTKYDTVRIIYYSIFSKDSNINLKYNFFHKTLIANNFADIFYPKKQHVKKLFEEHLQLITTT